MSLGYNGSGFFNLRDMEKSNLKEIEMEQPEGNLFYLEFKEPWFGGVDNLLLRMDRGESITLMELKEACDREGRELIVEII